jgi:signal transduction histidine kinase
MPELGTASVKTRSMEETFQDYEWKVRVKNYRTCLGYTIVFMLAGSTLDYIVYGNDGVLRFFPIRLVSALLLALGYMVLGTSLGQRIHRPLGLLLAMPLIGGISWMIGTTEGAESPYYAGLNLVLLGAAILMRWPLIDSVILVFMTLAFYLAACYVHGPIRNWPLFFNNCYFLVVTGVLTVAGTWMYNRIRFSEFCLRHDLDINRIKLQGVNEKLELKNRQLRELDQAKGRFFANISHELRTPLTLLIAPLESMMKSESNRSSDQAEFISSMHANAMRLLAMINDLLDLVRLESGKIPIRLKAVSLPEFVRGQVNAVNKLAENKGIHVSGDCDPALTHLMLDEEKLERICLNLLFNGIKFTPKGGRLSLIVLKEGDSVVFEVQDTGIGIEAKHVPHVFDRFWQADDSSMRSHKGLGVGLSLVKDITEAMGGSVFVQSELGVGTTMSIRLPLIFAGEGEQIEVRELSENRPANPTGFVREIEKQTDVAEMSPIVSNWVVQTAGARKPNLLIVDDEVGIRRFLAVELNAEYVISEAENGLEAVEIAMRRPPDIILCDMMMPEMDGLEVCRHLRANSETRDVPVIMLTARNDEKTKLSCLAAGANDFIVKPFSLAEVTVRLRNLAASHLAKQKIAEQNETLEDALSKLKEAEVMMVRNEKLASLGRLSAGLIHEVNNPLNCSKQALFVLRRFAKLMGDSEKAGFLENVKDIEDGIDRVSSIISDLRDFVSTGLPGKQVLDLKLIVETAVKFSSLSRDPHVSIRVDIPHMIEIRGHRNHLLQVVINLVQNSLDALKEKVFPEGEEALITLSAQKTSETVLMSVCDNGIGIDPENESLIFDPFFTTKDVGQGMGLGLSITHRIVVEHGGYISVRSAPGQFCEIVIEFPLFEKYAYSQKSEPLAH